MSLSLFEPAHAGEPFRCILMDPPWPERGGGKIKRGADRHYPLVRVEDMPGLVRSSPLWRPASDACHVWCWVTSNHLEHGLVLLRALGVRYVRDYVWAKTGVEPVDREHDETDAELDLLQAGLEMGIGQYGRGCHEQLLFGVIGQGQSPSVWTGDRAVRSVIFAPVPRGDDGKRIHSRKPDRSYALIERVSRGPRAELFARRRFNDSWQVWGNDAPKGETT